MSVSVCLSLVRVLESQAFAHFTHQLFKADAAFVEASFETSWAHREATCNAFKVGGPVRQALDYRSTHAG